MSNYLQKKRTSYCKYFFRCFSLQNPVIKLAKSIFAYNSRTQFFPDIQFSQNHKDNYSALFKPKKSTHQWISFNKIFIINWNPKKPYFGVILGPYPQNVIFSKKSSFVNFLPLRHPNFIRIFRKISSPVLGEKGVADLLADLLTAVV